jgi:hypothetical protein
MPRPDAWVREALGAELTYIEYVRPGERVAKTIGCRGVRHASRTSVGLVRERRADSFQSRVQMVSRRTPERLARIRCGQPRKENAILVILRP